MDILKFPRQTHTHAPTHKHTDGPNPKNIIVVSSLNSKGLNKLLRTGLDLFCIPSNTAWRSAFRVITWMITMNETLALYSHQGTLRFPLWGNIFRFPGMVVLESDNILFYQTLWKIITLIDHVVFRLVDLPSQIKRSL